MAVYGITRVSTDQQADDDKCSLAKQAEQIQGLCMMASLPAPTIVPDVVTGKTPLEERENAGPIIRALKAGDIIVASKLDRIFRNATDALNRADAWKAQGVTLYLIDMGADPVTNNGTARMFFGILALVAEFERERISERTKEGRMAKAAKLGYVGGPVPYGYVVEGEGKDAMLIADPQQQAMIASIRAMRGRPLRAIKAALGAQAPSIATISKILKGGATG